MKEWREGGREEGKKEENKKILKIKTKTNDIKVLQIEHYACNCVCYKFL